MSNTLDTLRQTLDAILAEAAADLDAQAAARARALDHREAQLAAAAEQITIDARVRAAWDESAAVERRRLVTLIDGRLCLPISVAGAAELRSLRKVVADG